MSMNNLKLNPDKIELFFIKSEGQQSKYQLINQSVNQMSIAPISLTCAFYVLKN